ncbi:MAG: LysR substrate-binding domain-containing protein [Burkholderiaceae bacterium]
MHRRTPPWGAIEAFIVAARVGSFKDAADELGLSASAFSRRIQALEGHIGAKLFDRSDAVPTLTAAGRRYLSRLEPGYSAIRAATDWMVPASGRRPLRVGVSQSFATSWLLPRLKDFQARHPTIEVTLHTRGRIDLSGGSADIGILTGDGRWPGLKTRKLLDLQAFIVCAPTMLDDGPGRLARLRRAPLLLTLSPSHVWQNWIDKTGDQVTESTERIYFDSMQVMFEAAAQGLGVALGMRPLVDAYLRDGRLVAPLEQAVSLPGGYYAAALPTLLREAPVRAFWQWLIEAT